LKCAAKSLVEDRGLRLCPHGHSLETVDRPSRRLCGGCEFLKPSRFAVVTEVGGRRLTAAYYDSLEEAERAAAALTEGSMSNPRAGCVYRVEEA
jgi:hypothetical protein